MYELVQVANNTYYMDCPTKVGFYKTSDKEVVLIDSGSDKDSAKKVKKILDEQGWTLKAIYNTHSHADHIGGNQYLQSQTGCKIYSRGIERSFIRYPMLEPMMLYGGYALEELHNKFLMAKESNADELSEEILPEGLSMISLPGHSYDMVGYRTSDDVVFLADSVSSKETLEKYQITFLYDVKSYIDTLEYIKTIDATYFVPSHGIQTSDIVDLAQINIEKTNEIANRIVEILELPRTFDELLSEVFDRFELTMTLQQNVLIGSTIKSYLSFLKEEGRVGYFFDKNRMLYKRTDIK